MYSEPTISTLQSVVTAIASAAASVGWTVLRNTTIEDIRIATIKRTETDYIHITHHDSTGQIRIRQSFGYNASTDIDNQPGAAFSMAAMDIGPGPYTKAYAFGHASAPTPHLYFIVEKQAGVFRHCAIGVLEKFGPFTGGGFADAFTGVDGPNPVASNISVKHSLFGGSTGGGSTGQGESGSIRCDHDGYTNNFASFSSGNYPGVLSLAGGGGYNDPAVRAYYEHADNPFAGTTPLLPFNVYVTRPEGFFSYLGSPPNIRFMNMQRFAPGEEFTIAGEVWKVIPWTRKGHIESQDCSQNYAYAYKKVA